MSGSFGQELVNRKPLRLGRKFGTAGKTSSPSRPLLGAADPLGRV
jgi:hypothetical protein